MSSNFWRTAGSLAVGVLLERIAERENDRGREEWAAKIGISAADLHDLEKGLAALQPLFDELPDFSQGDPQDLAVHYRGFLEHHLLGARAERLRDFEQL